MTDICAICHEVLNNSSDDPIHSLPECTHRFHTNCIITWFRAGHETCPLCNDRGVNTQEAPDYHRSYYGSSRLHASVYSRLARKANAKNAPKKLKQDVAKVRAYAKKMETFNSNFNEWLKSSHDLTAKQIIKEYRKRRQTKWRMKHNLRVKKQLIGYLYGQEETRIIIPRRIEIPN